MNIKYRFTEYIEGNKMIFLVELPVESFIKDCNFKFAMFIPSPNVVKIIKKKLDFLRPNPKNPIVYFLKCNSKDLGYLRNLAGDCKFKDVDFIVTAADYYLQERIENRLRINSANFINNKRWSQDFVNVDTLE